MWASTIGLSAMSSGSCIKKRTGLEAGEVVHGAVAVHYGAGVVRAVVVHGRAENEGGRRAQGAGIFHGADCRSFFESLSEDVRRGSAHRVAAGMVFRRPVAELIHPADRVTPGDLRRRRGFYFFIDGRHCGLRSDQGLAGEPGGGVEA